MIECFQHLQQMGPEELKDLQLAYQRVFKGDSTPEEGELVLIDLLSNVCRVFAINPHTNAQVYKTESKREVGVYVMYMVDMISDLAGLPPSKFFGGIAKSLNTAHQQKESARIRDERIRRELHDRE